MALGATVLHATTASYAPQNFAEGVHRGRCVCLLANERGHNEHTMMLLWEHDDVVDGTVDVRCHAETRR